MSHTSSKTIHADVVIFGGGIAGLWTLRSLLQQGYKTILLEADALGAGQTVKSQGIIHGGLKYALKGNLNTASQALQDMPAFWQNCLAGRGAIDLRTTKVLSDHQYMWSVNKLTGGVASLFASNAMRSQVKNIEQAQYPAAILASAIRSKLYKLSELVLNVPSLIRSLAEPVINNCIKIDNQATPKFELDATGKIKKVITNVNGLAITIQAQQFIFTAGTGNAELCKDLAISNTEIMQLRPLHMVMVKSKNLPPLFGHCIGLSATPRLTITTHIGQDHVPVWYLGGKLAEEGVNLTTEQLVQLAQQELKAIFPKLDLGISKWASFFVNRAEAKQADGSKPQTCNIMSQQNYVVAWPTKLALAPVLAEQIMTSISAQGIKPNTNIADITMSLSIPQIALPIWDQLL